METVNKVEYKVRHLNTRSVTLFPTRAQVSREITGVNLKPGTNEITVVGLSPTVEEESIKVEGSGSSAIITDIAVESLPNRDIFEEIYPDSSNDKSDSDSSDSESEEEIEQSPSMIDAKARLRDAQDELDLANEVVASAASRLKILDSYGTTLHEKEQKVDIQDELAKYKQQREQTFLDHIDGSKLQRDLRDQVDKIKREIIKIKRHDNKQIAKQDKAKAKVREEKEKKKSLKEKRDVEHQKEQQRIRREREKFWPQYCYSVRITIDYNVNTPLSSRRGSFASESDIIPVSSPKPTDKDTAGGPPQCDLVLSYVTSAAGWAPSYDLQLSTTNASAALCFDAQLTNTTSETWSNCKVVLSTSQATFGGLDDVTPTLNPWKIKLAPKGSQNKENNIIKSGEEAMHYRHWASAKKGNAVQKSRQSMFANASLGADKSYQTQVMLLEQQNKARLAMSKAVGFGSANTNTNTNTNKGGGFGNVASNSVPYQQQQPPPQQQVLVAQQQMGPSNLFGNVVQAPPQGGRPRADDDAAAMASGPIQAPIQSWTSPSDMPTMDDDQATLSQTALDPLDFEESLAAETGFTTTYDLPGLKTLSPRSTSSKQRVARLLFSNVSFNHTVVAKYRPVANLKARLKNTSKLTLLRGLAGLTLDGSFMGRTALPRCSAGDVFTLNLGVDPAIKLIYPKPEVRRATTGLFSKEDSSVYVRALTMQNTRAAAGKPVKITVQDQIPVSEDERLRVEIVSPKVQVDGVAVRVGEPGRDSRQDKDWGTATATLKKSGEVGWQVELNAGKAVRLSLEYCVSMPSGDAAVQCWE